MCFKFNGSDVCQGHGYGYGHFEFDAARDANDWPVELSHERPGKGAICTLRPPVIAVLSLA